MKAKCLNESKNERSRIYTSVLQEWELLKKKNLSSLRKQRVDT